MICWYCSHIMSKVDIVSEEFSSIIHVDQETHYHCTTCNAEYKEVVTLTQGTNLSPEALEKVKNIPNSERTKR